MTKIITNEQEVFKAKATMLISGIFIGIFISLLAYILFM